MPLDVFGPVPPGPPSLVGALVLVCVGIVGFLSILLQLTGRNRRTFNKRKMIFFAAILLFFIVIGLVELSHVR